MRETPPAIIFHCKMVLFLALLFFNASLSAEQVETTTGDGIRLFGESYFADLDSTTPLVLLFHQAAGDGRGEYAEIAGWLNTLGFRAIAWDQRSGGERFGGANRTAAKFPAGTSTEYCDVTPDLQAGLDYASENALANVIIAWGSSYSAALVFELAANNPEVVDGIVAMSPASGGPMAGCSASRWLDDVSVPILVMRPENEMSYENLQQQRDLLLSAGASFHVIANGVHGSSMLLDSRSGHDMSAARKLVSDWLLQFK